MAALMKGNCWKDRRDAKRRDGSPVVTYPVWVETKHDEIRCHVIVDEVAVHFLSYAGKPLANMQRFAETFITLSRGTGYKEFDVGFEVNGNFNDSYRWVRSTRGVPADLVQADCTFYWFGLPELRGTTMRMQRTALREVQDYAVGWCTIHTVLPNAVEAHSEAEVDALFTTARSIGDEGVMVKQPDMLYERKRTDGWLKMKPEDDADGVITDLHEAVCGVDQPELGLKAGDPLGRIGSVTVRMPDGSTAAPHGIPHDLGTEMHLNPQAYIGEWCEFKYMERDRQGGYRHPTFHRLREAK